MSLSIGRWCCPHKVYAQGRGDKETLEWTPVGSVVKALEGVFTLAFKVLELTGKS